jgi:hypothetical protein
MATSEASSEGVWIRNFITELGVVPNALDPLEILCDNTGAIALAKNQDIIQRPSTSTAVSI